MKTPVTIIRGKCAGRTGFIHGDLDDLNSYVTRIRVELDNGGYVITEIANLERREQWELKLWT